MQEDRLRLRWILPFVLALAGCGRGEEGSVPGAATAPVPPRQAAPVPHWLDAQALPSNDAALAPSAGTAGTAEAVLDPARLAQLGALPHLSALSPRERAGLLLLLPPMSPSERLMLINMYPSLVRLPVQQKEILLNKLAQIVPVAAAQAH